MKPIYSLFIMLSFAGQLRAQNDTTELFPYGDMNSGGTGSRRIPCYRRKYKISV